MKKRFLLVNPWIHDLAAYDLWVRPLGLLRLGRLLLDAGHEVHLIDLLNHGLVGEVSRDLRQHPKRLPSGCGKFYRQELPKPAPYARVPRRYCRYGLPPGYAARLLDGLPRPDAALVTSGMTYWYPGVRETISFLRERWPGLPVVLGGIYASLCLEHARETSGADHVVAGPAAGGDLELLGLPGPEACPAAGSDPWPLPALELCGGLEGLPLATTSGCPFACAYCASPRLAGGYKAREPGSVAAEVLHWHRTLGARHFAFFDDALLLNPGEHFIPMAGAIAGLNLPLCFHAPNGLHVGSISREVAEAMRGMGLETLRLSLETAAEGSSGILGRKTSRGDFLEALENLEAAGYRRREIGVYLLGGLPGQRWEEVAESIIWVARTGSRPYLSIYSPIPGTGLWKESARRSPFPLAEDPLYQNNSIFPCRWEAFNESHLPLLKVLMKETRPNLS